MRSLYLWGRCIQEIGGDVVIGHSIYGVVVIDGWSLYSDSMVAARVKYAITHCVNVFQFHSGRTTIYFFHKHVSLLDLQFRSSS